MQHTPTLDTTSPTSDAADGAANTPHLGKQGQGLKHAQGLQQGQGPLQGLQNFEGKVNAGTLKSKHSLGFRSSWHG
jgi:hypothetical protein